MCMNIFKEVEENQFGFVLISLEAFHGVSYFLCIVSNLDEQNI